MQVFSARAKSDFLGDAPGSQPEVGFRWDSYRDAASEPALSPVARIGSQKFLAWSVVQSEKVSHPQAPKAWSIGRVAFSDTSSDLS
ncbi:MAG TPA: hypothetical protein VNO32_34435 [Candidatus Acidoferrum sp.]|nr:hypothetical protein [Candidatus Acidoferrum sp.]